MAIVFLQVQNVSKAFGEEEILNEVGFQVREGERFGLIGPNGAGKSTLFRIITGEQHADTGLVSVPRGVRVGYLEQEAEILVGGTVLAELLASRSDIVEIEARMHELETAMSAPAAHEDYDAFDRLLHEHARLAEEFHHLGGDTLENDAKRILRGLGMPEVMDDFEVMVLSGGQKRRLALAKLLLTAPDLMLLDEPTNHLDLAAINWLEDYLNGYRGAVLIVSHDRFLLDRVCNHIAEIEDTHLRQFDGNYTAYQEKKQAENEMMLKRSDTIAREKIRLEAIIQKLFSFRQYTRMRSMQKQLYKLQQVTLPGMVDKTRMVFKPSKNSGREVLTVDRLKKRFDKPLLDDITFTLWRKERAALLGPNGSGKTTLLRVLVEEMKADGGKSLFGHHVDWYYYDQEGRNLDVRNTVLEEVATINPHLSQSEIRGALARFLLFEEDVTRMVGTLSGGERSRVSLTKMFLSGANLLILDEPTNHLDIDGKESLESALTDYPGTVLMVSHDRYFIDRVCNRVLELHEGKIRSYNGNYSEYMVKLAQPDPPPPPAPINPVKHKTSAHVTVAPPAPVAPPKAKPKHNLQYWQRKRHDSEEQIALLEQKVAELEAQLADSTLYLNTKKVMKVTADHEAKQAELRQAFEHWEEICGEILKIEG